MTRGPGCADGEAPVAAQRGTVDPGFAALSTRLQVPGYGRGITCSS